MPFPQEIHLIVECLLSRRQLVWVVGVLLLEIL